MFYKDRRYGILYFSILMLHKYTASIFNKVEAVITYTDKYNKRSDESDNFYIVLDNKTVIENKDLVFKGYFDSADKQAQLKVGDKVKVKTIGYRIPILSTYPKLYEIERMN